MDQASFIAALVDKVSGPARKMKSQLSGLGRAFSDVNKAAKRDELGRFVGRSGGMLNKLEGKFRGVGKQLAGAVEMGVGKLKDGMVLGGVATAGVAVGIGAATVKMADFAQTSRMGFAAVAKGGESAEALFSNARSMAERFGMDVMQASDAYRGFLQQGADKAMAGQLLGMAGDMTAFGRKAEQVESVLYNVNKILAQGKAQGDELGPIFEVMNADKFYKNLGQSIGKTKDELLKMKDAGQLTSDMILPALVQTSNQEMGIGQAGDFASKSATSSIGGIAGVLKAKAQNSFIDIGSGATSGIMGALGPLADELGNMFKSESFQSGIIGAVEMVAQLVRDAIPYVKEFALSFGSGFLEAMPAMQGAVDVLVDFFGNGQDTMEFVKSFGKTLGQLAAGAVTVGVVFGGILLTGVQIVTGMVQGAIFMWNSLIDGIGAALFAVDDFFSNIGAKWRAFDFGALAGNLIDGLVNGISSGAQWVIDAVSNLGSAVIKKFEDVLDIGSPSKEFKYLGQMSGLGYAIGLERSLAANDNLFALPSVTGGVGGEARTLPSFTGSVGSLMGAGGGGGGGDVYVTVHMENHFSGGDSEAHARAVKHTFMTELGAALETMVAGSAA